MTKVYGCIKVLTKTDGLLTRQPNCEKEQRNPTTNCQLPTNPKLLNYNICQASRWRIDLDGGVFTTYVKRLSFRRHSTGSMGTSCGEASN